AYVALHQAFRRLTDLGLLDAIPLTDQVAAVSCGLYKGAAVLDLDYEEDSNAEADANFVLTGRGGIVEIQGTAEHSPFSEAQFLELLALAKSGAMDLVRYQREALGL
ncbi:MAG: ribonuclease PH, partial [Rhodospirillales bacterium]